MHGSGRGKQLGYPTANLQVAPHDRPKSGIYACWVRIEGNGQRYRGALHSGPRPAFGETDPTVEIHILDWGGGSLYGVALSFQCVKRLRAVQKFATAEELAAAITEDCQKARATLR